MSCHGNIFTLLNVVRTFANSHQSILQWCWKNHLHKTVVETFFSDIEEALLADEEDRACFTLEVLLANLRQDTDTVDNVLLQILCDYFHDQIYVRHFSNGVQRFIRLSDGNITYQHEHLDSDCFVMCIYTGSKTSTIRSNCQVSFPMNILIQVLQGKDFSNNYMSHHIIETVNRSATEVLLHKNNTYLGTLRQQFDVPCILSYYVYNSLLVFIPSSVNPEAILKKFLSDLKIIEAEKHRHLIQPTVLDGRYMVISDGGIIETLISSDRISRRCVKCWVNTGQLSDPSTWEAKLREAMRDIINEVDVENSYRIHDGDYKFNGSHLLWTSILMPNIGSKDDLVYDMSYNKYLRFTDSSSADTASLLRFHIKLPKNSINNVHIVFKSRDGHPPDVTAIRRWMEKFPLGLTNWSLLKNNRTTLLRVCGIDSTLPVDYIRRKIQKCSSEHFYIDSVKVNYKTHRRDFDAVGIRDRICKLLRADVEDYANFSVHIDTKESNTNILGIIDTSRYTRNELQVSIARLKYGEGNVHISEHDIDVINMRNSIFDAIEPKIKQILKDDPNVKANKTSLITDYVSLELSSEAKCNFESQNYRALSKIIKLTKGVQLKIKDQSILKSAKGVKMLSAMCAKYATTVELADRTLTVYGSSAASNVHDIERYCSDESEKKWKTLHVRDFVQSMKTSTKMAIIIKTFVSREKRNNFINKTYNYDALMIATGVTDLFIDLQASTIKYRGSTASAALLQSMLGDKLSETQYKMSTPSETEVGLFRLECVSCFMPVMHSLYHSLRQCGHLYCRECLLIQMEVTAQSRSFPLTCAADQCNALFSWRDVEDVYCGDSSGQEKLVDAALEKHLINKPSEGFFCLQPDCPGLLLRCLVDIKTTKKTSCAKCDTSYCILCKVPFHEGQTCSEYKMDKVTIEHHLQEWINEKKDDRKLCPYCDSGIEKNGGCNAVHCIHCKMYICWKCLDIFTESTDTYSHLHEKHNGSY